MERKCGNRKRRDEFNEKRSLISRVAEVPSRKIYDFGVASTKGEIPKAVMFSAGWTLLICTIWMILARS